jgi:hypothetical protein
MEIEGDEDTNVAERAGLFSRIHKILCKNAVGFYPLSKTRIGWTANAGESVVLIRIIPLQRWGWGLSSDGAGAKDRTARIASSALLL